MNKLILCFFKAEKFLPFKVPLSAKFNQVPTKYIFHVSTIIEVANKKNYVSYIYIIKFSIKKNTLTNITFTEKARSYC